ncbi:MAG: fumarylacetoacetase [Muricauda sp.]|jgi:fumarylacetoacetase|nr:fumarylacetoacetase [Allomuricauda sp.]MBO6531985.1 fumarylacetoacetase [Allomuricauda sp.]MBO6589930.1 fumarylacetoacetase [Allomuricauda sp.]MBO6619556.1 fumarylacetoacetase [Allomuricauda sp.]MBO6645475.1 fumarylacetoacetase [Allomuricauda sp.]MBO6747682.1 fumarylacetoacetase [Allomuricauda sp.]
MIIEIPENSDFSIHNIPFGIFSTQDRSPRIGVAIGEHILDLAAVAELDVFDFNTALLEKDTLNDFISLGKEITTRVRKKIQHWIKDDDSVLAGKPELFVKQSEAQMHMPVAVGDYTDFYSSLEHATNVGKMFRDPENALLPNWKHIPVGYHGRASSIIVSGQPIHRPKGQTMPNGLESPVFGPTKRLDFELEIGFICGKETKLGESVSTANAEDYIFGMVLFNDWSARDIQKWEYVPLGPFLAKNFASSISPWVVTLEALEPFKLAGPKQEPEVLPYLTYEGKKNYDIHLEVGITPEQGEETTVCQSNFKHMYWNMAQQLAHHTVNGCNINIGDMMASGTISGKEKNSFGSMLELSWGGTQPIQLKDGSVRKFIEDGDTVTMRGYAQNGDIRVGFGEVSAKVLPAK